MCSMQNVKARLEVERINTIVKALQDQVNRTLWEEPVLFYAALKLTGLSAGTECHKCFYFGAGWGGGWAGACSGPGWGASTTRRPGG